jgi:HAD superfamily hydrolase (TIGR01549 family)
VNPATKINNIQTLGEILNKSKALMLDFDGPVCSVFSGISASYVAQELRNHLSRHHPEPLPADIRNTNDPFEILYYAAELGATQAARVELILQACETAAVTSARINPHTRLLIEKWNQLGLPLAIVSNNSFKAIKHYVELLNLPSEIEIFARSSSNVKHLKPSPYLLECAVEELGLQPASCAFIGDSESDLLAGEAAGVPVIGYGNKRPKVDRFQQMSFRCVISDMHFLVEALHG